MNFKSLKLSSTLSAISVVTASVCSGDLSRIAHAEGSVNFQGAFGVNRRVQSTQGAYTSATATGTMSFSNVPAGGGPYNDKPSFYQGGTVGSNEIDAGLQYEPAPLFNIDPGWAAFISVARGANAAVFCNPEVVRASDGLPIPWRGGESPIPMALTMSSSISSEMTYRISDGLVTVSIGSLNSQSRVPIVPTSGTFFYNESSSAGTIASRAHPLAPWSGVGSQVVAGDVSQARIKRVMAMTRRRSNDELDGSQLTGTWQGAFGATVDQATTGHDAPANGSPFDRDGFGDYKVSFPNLDEPVSDKEGRTNSLLSRLATQGGVSRYNTETVAINLRQSPARGIGRPGGPR